MCQRLDVRAQRLQRRVRGVEREIEEEGPVTVGLDGTDRLISEIVGHVSVRRKALRAVPAHGIIQIGPEERIDRVEILAQIDRVGMVRRQEKRRSGIEADPFVKTLVLRLEGFCGPQMPLADEQGAVAAVAQDLRHGDLVRRQALLVGRDRLSDPVIVEDRLARAIVERADQAVEGHRRRCEFKAEPRRITARHDRRARGRTGGIAGIAVDEYRAIGGDGVDIRGRHIAGGQSAAECGDVIDTQIVDQDDDDIRRPLAGAVSAVCGPWSQTTCCVSPIGSRQRSSMPGSAIR